MRPPRGCNISDGARDVNVNEVSYLVDPSYGLRRPRFIWLLLDLDGTGIADTELPDNLTEFFNNAHWFHSFFIPLRQQQMQFGRNQAKSQGMRFIY